jgi:hypothetical protein
VPRTSWVLFLICAVRSFAASEPASTPLPANSVANAVQVDSAGNLYLAGFYSSDFNSHGAAHAFVAKLSPDALKILWWTPLAGSKDDRAQALALGPDNSVYVTGKTQSADFPTTTGVFDPAGAVGGNTFAAKFDANGVLVYATYIPATSGEAITTDAAGDAFITGVLNQNDALKATPGTVSGVPTFTNALGCFPSCATAFIIELDPVASRPVLTIAGFGGAQIALDSSGNIYAAGSFVGPLAPTTPGAFQATATARICGSSRVSVESCSFQHIAKINPTGSHLIYATYLSGTWGATPTGLAVDEAGNAIIAGTTSSPDYPTTPDAYQSEYFGSPSPQLHCLLMRRRRASGL